MIRVDLIGPLKSTRQGNQYILSFIDYYTKYAVITEIPKNNEKVVYFCCKHCFLPKACNVDVTSGNFANFDSEKSKKMKVSADKIYYNFSQKTPNIKTI